MRNRCFRLGLLIFTVGMCCLVGVDVDGLPLDGVFEMVATAGFALAAYSKLTAHLARVNRPADEAFEAGYEVGYDVGWREGRAAGRPTLVKLPARYGVPDMIDSASLHDR